MICYKDMTFCGAKCKNTDCERLYTESVRESAIQWWGNEDAPVAMADFSSVCPDYIPIDS